MGPESKRGAAVVIGVVLLVVIVIADGAGGLPDNPIPAAVSLAESINVRDDSLKEPEPRGLGLFSMQSTINLTVTILSDGYEIAHSSPIRGGGLGILLGTRGGGKKRTSFSYTIPAVEAPLACEGSRYRKTLPPPRPKNAGRSPCVEGNITYWQYDIAALRRRLIAIKSQYPDERRLIVAAEADIAFDAIADLFDATRTYVTTDGETRPLFDEIVLSPGLS